MATSAPEPPLIEKAMLALRIKRGERPASDSQVRPKVDLGDLGEGASFKIIARKPRRDLAGLRDTFKEWAGFVTETAKAASLLSAPFGLFLLIAYMGRVGAPLPVLDSSTALLLLIVAASYTFLSCAAIAFLLAPSFTCTVDERSRILIRTKPLLRTGHGSPLSSTSLHNEYIVFHAGSILLFPTCAANLFLTTSLVTFAITLVLAVMIGAACSIVKYATLGIPPYRSGTYQRKFRQKMYSRIIWGSLLRFLMTLFWILSFTQVLLAIGARTSLGSSPYLNIYLGIVLLSLMPLYFFLTNRRVVIFRVPVLMLLMAITFASFAPSFFGGVALKALGVGGGIPISLAVTPVATATTKDAPVQDKIGCLLLRSGTETIIRVLDKPTSEKCSLSWSEVFGREEIKPGPRSSDVEAIPSSRILQMTGFKP